jgi:hypothetical protein
MLSPNRFFFGWRHHRRARRSEQGQNAGRGPIAVIIGVSASAPAVLTGSAYLVEPIFKREHVVSHETWRRRRR